MKAKLGDTVELNDGHLFAILEICHYPDGYIGESLAWATGEERDEHWTACSGFYDSDIKRIFSEEEADEFYAPFLPAKAAG